jgi:hypothetical protein
LTAGTPPSPDRVSNTRCGAIAVNPLVGVTGADGADGSPTPWAFDATTVNVWGTPLARSSTVHVNGPLVHTQVLPPGDDVTTYCVMAEPPSETGGDQLTDASALPASATTEVGGPGGFGKCAAVRTAAPASTIPAPQWNSAAGSLEHVKDGWNGDGGNDLAVIRRIWRI